MSCVFCDIAVGGSPAHEVFRSSGLVAFLDRSPLFEGHTLVVPSTHVPTLADLASDGIEPFFALVQRIAAALPDVLGSEGSFVAINNVVSQSVPHLHAHVVPRTKGDGLRGFFWPRTSYADDATAAAVAARIAAALAEPPVL